MKKLYCLAAGLLLAGATLKAQIDPVDVNTVVVGSGTAVIDPGGSVLPCSTFDDPASPAGNWVTSFCAATYGNTNPLDGSQCATLYDQAGGSWYTNTVDYNNLGQNHLNKCLCFDYALINDGGSGVPFYPTIYLSDGINTIAFVSSTPVSPGSGWIRVCAPIQHCVAGGGLPSNASGSWVLVTGSTCTDFNNVLDNVTSVGFPTDINSCPCEEMEIDNVCVTNCTNCQANFRLDVSYNSDGTAYGNVFLNTTDPSSYYTVDWGDGSVTTPYVTHIYSNPGTYNVCVTQYNNDKKVICRVCMRFCYGRQVNQDVVANTDDVGEETNPGDVGGEETGTGGRSAATNVSGVLMRTLNDNKFSDEGFIIFPNPSKEYTEVLLSLPEKGRASVKVIDMLGRVVAETTGSYARGTQKIKINTESLPAGVYNVEINVGGNTSFQKLSVTK